MPSIGGVSEVILYVEEMEPMVAFYQDTFDLEIESGAVEHGFVSFATGACRLCLHAGRDGAVGPYAPKVVFSVEDIEAARAELVEDGVEVGEIRAGGPDSQVVDGVDPEGNTFSLEAAG